MTVIALMVFIVVALGLSLALALKRRKRQEGKEPQDLYRGDELDQWMDKR